CLMGDSLFNLYGEKSGLAPGLGELQEGADLRLECGVGPLLGAVESPDHPATRRHQERARNLVAQVQPVRNSSLRRPVALERRPETAAVALDAAGRVGVLDRDEDEPPP